MFAALRLARRLHLGVLLLWLACVGAAAASPWLGHAPAMAGVCSAGALPGAADATPPDRTHPRSLDCPMCLPLGTPAPAGAAATVPALGPDLPVADRPGVAREHDRLQRPPARAPPEDSTCQR